MTAVLAVRRWSEFVYQIRPQQPGGCTPFEGPVEDFGDYATQEFVTAECTRIKVTAYLDSSYTVDIHYQDGQTERIEAVAGDFVFPETEQNPQQFVVHHRFGGHEAVYTRHLDLEVEEPGIADVLDEDIDGSFRLGKARVSFALHREYFPSEPDEFTATLPGSTKVELTVPFDPGAFQPRFDQAARGRLTLPTGSLAFALSSDDPEAQRWTKMVINPDLGRTGTNVTGQFRLNPDYSGQGQVYRGRGLAFVAGWNDRQQASVVLPNGTATSAGPAAALIDFANLRWSGLGSAFGPSPGS